MSEVDLSVKVHIAFEFRDDQNEGDVFELYSGGDPFWLNEAEVRYFRDRLDGALRTYAAATAAIEAAAADAPPPGADAKRERPDPNRSPLPCEAA